MLYRLKLDLSFPQEEHLQDVLDKVKDVFSHAVTINPGSDHEEVGYYQYHHCYHDDDVTLPCPIQEQQFTPI